MLTSSSLFSDSVDEAALSYCRADADCENSIIDYSLLWKEGNDYIYYAGGFFFAKSFRFDLSKGGMGCSLIDSVFDLSYSSLYITRDAHDAERDPVEKTLRFTALAQAAMT